jgi:hypothetical protein
MRSFVELHMSSSKSISAPSSGGVKKLHFRPKTIMQTPS